LGDKTSFFFPFTSLLLSSPGLRECLAIQIGPTLTSFDNKLSFLSRSPLPFSRFPAFPRASVSLHTWRRETKSPKKDYMQQPPFFFFFFSFFCLLGRRSKELSFFFLSRLLAGVGKWMSTDCPSFFFFFFVIN